MYLTVKMKLVPDRAQAAALSRTFEAFNAACKYISEWAFREKCFNAFKLHYALYRTVRAAFPSLSSQFVVRAFKKVAASYKVDRKVQHTFKTYSAVVYDPRLLSFPNLSTASITTVDGRQKIPLRYRRLEVKALRGEADLVYQRKKFFLCVVIELPDGTPLEPKGYLGVDKGIVAIATTSDGVTFSGSRIDAVRERTATLRQALQKKGSKAAKRHLKKLGSRQKRFQQYTNHCIAKELVSKAKGTMRGIALEDLTGIRSRIRLPRAARQRFGNWAFFQLDTFIRYKARLRGVPVVFVDPRGTSRTCHVCGDSARSSRKSQSLFSCGTCGCTCSADINAAINIARRAAVNQPIAVHPPSLSHAPAPGTAMPRQLLAAG